MEFCTILHSRFFAAVVCVSQTTCCRRCHRRCHRRCLCLTDNILPPLSPPLSVSHRQHIAAVVCVSQTTYYRRCHRHCLTDNILPPLSPPFSVYHRQQTVYARPLSISTAVVCVSQTNCIPTFKSPLIFLPLHLEK